METLFQVYAEINLGNIVAAFNGGVIPLYESQESACYNFSLPYAFLNIPDVAIGIEDFEIDPSYGMYFYVKATRAQTPTYIPFVIRTLWAYTSWTQINFNFIAEDRNDIDSGYYQIDSGDLGGCHTDGFVQVLLPFKTIFSASQPIRHSIFLHGFEITTISIGNSVRSPFEVQLTQTSANISGLAVQISVTTATQLNSLYISYIAYQNLDLEYRTGSFIFDTAVQVLL